MSLDYNMSKNIKKGRKKMKNKFKLSVIIGLLLSSLGLFFISPTAVAAAETTSTVKEVSTFTSLCAAVENENIEEIVITKEILLPENAELDGKNKIFRANVTGVNEQGIVTSGSSYSLFNNGYSDYTVSLKNMKI